MNPMNPVNPTAKGLRPKAKIQILFSAFSPDTLALLFALAFSLYTSAFLQAAPTNSVSAYKPLMIGTTNEQPANAGFWNSNAAAISAAIGSGGGGGSDIYNPLNFLTNGSGQIDVQGPLKTLSSNNAVSLTNLQAPQLLGTLPLATLPSAILTNNFTGVITFLSSLAVNGAINCLSTINGAAGAFTAGVSAGSLTVATNATVGASLTVATNITAGGTNTANYSKTANTATANLFADNSGDQIGNFDGFLAIYSSGGNGVYFGASSFGAHDLALEAGSLTLGPATAGNAGTLNASAGANFGGAVNVTGAVTATGFTANSGSFTGSGAGLTGVPGSAITGTITVMLTNGLATGAWTYYTANYTNSFGPTGSTNICNGITNSYGTNGLLVISSSTGSFSAGPGGVMSTNGFASYATNSVSAITATAWGNTNGMNGFIWLSGATNMTIFDAQSNIVAGPQSLTNLGYKVAFPICAGGGFTNSSAVFTFHAL